MMPRKENAREKDNRAFTFSPDPSVIVSLFEEKLPLLPSLSLCFALGVLFTPKGGTDKQASRLDKDSNPKSTTFR